MVAESGLVCSEKSSISEQTERKRISPKAAEKLANVHVHALKLEKKSDKQEIRTSPCGWVLLQLVLLIFMYANWFSSPGHRYPVCSESWMQLHVQKVFSCPSNATGRCSMPNRAWHRDATWVNMVNAPLHVEDPRAFLPCTCDKCNVQVAALGVVVHGGVSQKASVKMCSDI